MATKKTHGDFPKSPPNGWDIFTITYKLPMFGSDPDHPTYADKEIIMMVGTQGGRSDAEEACKKYHKGCQILMIQNFMEATADIKVPYKKGKNK